MYKKNIVPFIFKLIESFENYHCLQLDRIVNNANFVPNGKENEKNTHTNWM